MGRQTQVDDPIASSDLELDKTGGGWVLTAWPAGVPSLVLRLRIREYLSVEDPFSLILEVRAQADREFSKVAVLDSCAAELLAASGRDDGWSEVPTRLLSAFVTMVRTLGAILRLTELGGTPHQRYRGEPLTSRDYYYFGTADDLPRQTSWKSHVEKGD